jgi:CRP-like cAMP-binding protein
MDPYERSKLGDAFIEEKYKKGDYVIREGEIGDKFYIVADGEAIATKMVGEGKEPKQVMEYKKGAYFGEKALLTNEARAANIIVKVSYKCFC